MFKLKLQICLIVIIIIFVNSETDLSNNNCPEEFNITQLNTTSGIGFSELAVFYFSPFTSQQTTLQVQQIIIQGDYQALDTLINQQYIIPFIAIAAIFGITYLIVLMCIIFQKSCPPCHSWRRDFSKRPYEKFQLRCVALFAVIFSLGIFITTIVCFTVIPILHTELQNTKCGLYNALDIALNGDGDKWGGFSHIKNQVGNISKLLPSTSSEINTFFNDDETLVQSMEALKTLNLDIYNQQKDSTVLTPDPTATTAAITAGDPVPPVDSYFIQTKLGPNGTDNTMINDIDTALRSTQRLSDQANQIIKSAFIIVQSSQIIESNTNNSQELLTMYQDQLNDFKVQLDTFSLNYFDPIFSWGIYVAEVVIGFVLISSLALIIGAISIQFLRIHECRYFLHCGWVVYGITYFGIIFVAFFTLPMASVGYTFCQYLNASLQNETQYSRIGEYYSQNVLTKLDVCLFGDGNVLQKFQIQNDMDTVALMFQNIQTFKAYQNNTNKQYVDQAISSDQLDQWKSILENYRDGITKDSDPLLTTQQNPVKALQGMNDYTLWVSGSSQTPTRCSRDRWVYYRTDCQDTDNQYTTPATVAQGKIISMDYDTCIPLHTKIASSQSQWTLTDITDRYKQIKNSCPTVYQTIIEYARSIVNYRDSRQNLFQSLIDQIDALKNAHDTFIVLLDAFRQNLDDFSTTTAISNLNNFVTNEIDGLLVSSKCQPIGERLKFIHNSFCVNAMGYAVQAGICMLVLMALMIGGLFTGCVFAQRVATVSRLHKIQEDAILALPQSSIHNQSANREQTFEKIERFERKSKSSSDSSSSSSSDED